MLTRLRAFGRHWRSGQSGMAEAAAAFIVLPILVAMILVLVEVGMNLRYRSMVDSILQDTVHGISQDGAVQWPASGTNPAGLNWVAFGQQTMQKLCGAKRCNGTPTMSCSVAGGTNLYGGVAVAPTAGSAVICTAVFPYRPILTGSQAFNNLGFGRMWTDPIRITLRSKTVVGAA